MIIFRKINELLKNISIVDKFVTIFMLILLVETSYILFSNAVKDTNNIDVIIRTSASSIFGYILSGNFAHSQKCKKNDTKQYTTENRIINESEEQNTCTNPQIVIVSIIGICALITLIVFRNTAYEFANKIIIIGQLRDYISASIGFLVSCGKRKAT